MTDMTPARLAELKAVAEAANAEWYSKAPTVALRWYHEATYPPTVLSLIAALEAKTYEAERLRAMGQGLIKQRDEARAAIERVREAATEVASQGDNLGRTHYEGCWKHHLHCLAAKIIYETGAGDATQP